MSSICRGKCFAKVLAIVLPLLLLLFALVATPGRAMADEGASDEVQVDTWSALYEALQMDGANVKLTANVKFGEGGGEHVESALDMALFANVTIDLNGYTIDRGLAASDPVDDGYVIKVYSGSLTLNDSSATNSDRTNGTGKITGGNTTGSGGGVYVINHSGGAHFTLNGGNIVGNAAKGNGGGAGVNHYSDFTMNGGVIEDNVAGEDGGGVWVTEDKSFTLNAGVIRGNSAKNGGGAIASNATLAGGTIANNTAISDGGGYYGGAIMSGTVISGNAAATGGAVRVKGQNFVMNGGEVSGNEATGDGGGFYLSTSYGDGSITVNGGVISDNKAAGDGGGMHLNGPLAMSGGSISGNSSTKGGGIYANGVTVAAKGGSIKGNNATTAGGGVYCHYQSIKVSGNPVISGNTAGDEANSVASNVFLDYYSDMVIVDDALTKGASIGVTPEAYGAQPRVITSGWAENMGEANPATYFTSDDGYAVALVDGEAAVLTPWQVLQTKLDAGGVVKLEEDVTALDTDTYLIVPSDVIATLDLNGHVLNRGRTGYVNDGFVIKVEGALTIKDSNPTATHDPAIIYIDPNDTGKTVTVNGGIITGGYFYRGGGIHVNGGNLTLESGSIACNTSAGSGGYGGGVYMANAGIFTMTGGSICGNTVNNGGSGVYAEGASTVVISEGTIQGNKGTDAECNGSVCVVGGSSFTMSGGAIVDNAMGNAGGVYASDEGTSFTLSGGEIKDNVASYDRGVGGGVRINGTVVFTMTGGAITGNKCTGGNSGSGGVEVNDRWGRSTFTMSGGTISGNSASGSGGVGIYSCDFTMSGDASITGNSAANGDGGGLQATNSAVVMKGNATISKNTATGSGGGVMMWYGSLDLSDSAAIKDNTAGVDGGGICDNGVSTITLTGDSAVSGNSGRNGGGVSTGNTTLSGNASISGNTATGAGGGVIGTLTVTGGAIANNTAAGNGGGVYASSDNSVTLSGGSITSNSVTGESGLGGGIYSGGSGCVRVSGAPVVSGNTAGNVDNNVYLLKPYYWMDGDRVTVAGQLTEGASIGVTTVQIGQGAQSAPITSGYSTYNDGDDPARFFFGDGGYVAYRVEDEAVLMSPWQHLNMLLDAGGTIQLDRDYTAMANDVALSVPDGITVTLDLNGHVLDRALTEARDGGNVILVNAGGNLTVIDSTPGTEHDPARSFTEPLTDKRVEVKGGLITGGYNTGDGGGIYVERSYSNHGFLTLNGGTIAGNVTQSAGGGMAARGTMTMNGGCIGYNTSAGDGGGVRPGNGSGTFTMTGGTIIGNFAAGNGGGVRSDNETGGWIDISGGTITGNSAADGAGIYVGWSPNSPKYQLSGTPVVTGNKTTAGADNNVCLASGRVLSINGKLVEGAAIGVTTETVPVAGSPVVFTGDFSDYNPDDDPRAYFSSDAGYAVGVLGGDVALCLSRVDVAVTPGENMTWDEESGAQAQVVYDGADMAEVAYRADDGFYFPEDYASLGTVSGVTIARADEVTVTVSGAPEADVSIQLASPSPLPAIAVEGGYATDEKGATITQALPGAEVKLVATPDDKHLFKEWQVVSGGVEIGESTFTMGAEDVSVKAVFVDKYILLEFGVDGGGNFTVNSSEPYGGWLNMMVENGEAIALAATPAEGYGFAGWYEGVVGPGGYVDGHTDTLVSPDAAYSFSATEGMALCAVFEPVVSNITVEGGHAEQNGAEVTRAAFGSAVSVVADEAPEGQRFDHWEFVSGISSFDLGEGSFTMPASAVELRAVFAPVAKYWKRLAGDGRYDTMAAIVEEGFAGTSDVAVLATGYNFPDALAASALAGAYSAPVVLTDGRQDFLDSQARAQLERLGVEKVFIMGGEAAVSAGIKDDVAALNGGVEVVRLAGAGRIQTSVLAYEQVRGRLGTPKTVILAVADGFADTLSVGSWSYAAAAPILLVGRGEGLTDDVAATVRAADRVVIVGGTAVVSREAEVQAAAIVGADNVVRLAGENRYDTSAAIARWCTGRTPGAAFQPPVALSMGAPAIATGKNFPDALAGAALCGGNGSVLVLADEKGDAGVVDLVACKDLISRGYFLGGESAVGVGLADYIVEATGGEWVKPSAMAASGEAADLVSGSLAP